MTEAYSNEDIMQAINDSGAYDMPMQQPIQYQNNIPQQNEQPTYTDEEILAALQQPETPTLQGNVSHTEFAQQHPVLEGLADIGEGSLPIIGGVAGSFVSPFVGTAGGAATGELWKRNIETLRGERPATYEQAAKNIGASIGEGAIAGTGEKIIGSALPLVNKLLKKGGDFSLQYLAGIAPELTAKVTAKGSQALNYLNKIKDAPEDMLQKLTESDIRVPLNETLLKFKDGLGKEIGQIKEDLFPKVKNIKLKIDDSLKEISPTLQNLFTDKLFQSDLESSIFKKRFLNIVKEARQGVTPKRGDELVKHLDKYVINYKKEFGDLVPFDQEIQKMASILRDDLKGQIHKLSPKLAEYDNMFSQYSDLVDAMPKIAPIKELSKKEGTRAAGQSAAIKQMLTSPDYTRAREILSQLPGGTDSLSTADDLMSAANLLNINLDNRVPLSKWAAMAEMATTIPRKYAINKKLPSMLAENEGRYTPNLVEQILNQKGIGTGTTTLIDQLLRGQ